MPAALTEAFKDPKIDSAAYTRSTLDSLKNPQFGGNYSYNSHIHSGVSAHPVSYGVQFGGANYGASSSLQTSSSSDYDIVNRSFRNNQSGGSSSNSDTVSLLSSISTSSLSNEAESIKKKYQIEHFEDDGDSSQNQSEGGKKCDSYVYHILSCSKCRKKMKKLLQDNDKDEFQDSSTISLKDLKDLLGGDSQEGGNNGRHDTFRRNNNSNNQSNLDFNYLMENDNLQNISMFVLSGIFLIFLLDFFKRL